MLRFIQCGISSDEVEGGATGLDQNLNISQKLGYFEVRHTALTASEERPLPPNGEVYLGELETVLVFAERIEPLPRVLGLWVADEEALGGMQPAADPAAQLV
jgi:hypothetical protein